MVDFLTFCGVYRNEAVRIREVLEIGRYLCKDIRVAVQESEDKTLQICREYTESILERPSESPEESKDFLMEQVKTPWTFWLDADEVPSMELIHWIETLTPMTLAGYDSVRVPRVNYVNGIHVIAGQPDDKQYRLLSNSVRWNPVAQGQRIHIYPVVRATLDIPYPIFHHRTLEKIERQTQRWNDLEPKTAPMCNKYVEDVRKELV